MYARLEIPSSTRYREFWVCFECDARRTSPGPCDDCGRPLDYDYNTDRFVHAEEPATGCWLHAGIEEG